MKLRIALAAVSLALVAAIVWLSVRVSQQRDRIAVLEAKLGATQGPVQPPPASPVAPAPAVPAHEGSAASKAPATRTSCPEMEALGARLQETANALTRAQARITELEGQMDDLNKERTRWATLEKQMQVQIADLKQTIEAMHSERPQLTQRIKDAEAEANRLRQQVQVASQKNTQFTQLTTDFKDLARRQQSTSTNILRRYRELTDLFRSLPGMVEVRGNGPELSRIQTAISGADEDLRQLNELNTRLNRLQTQIVAAK